MSTAPILHDLYTLFFSYTQSSLYRTFLRTFTTSLPSFQSFSSPSPSDDHRLQRDFVLYSQMRGAMSESELVMLSFVLFLLFLVVFPLLALLSVSAGFHGSLWVYLSCLSTVYVVISSGVYALVLLESMVKGVQSFPLTVTSLVFVHTANSGALHPPAASPHSAHVVLVSLCAPVSYLYFLNVFSFTVTYYVILGTYDFGAVAKGSGRQFEGMEAGDGVVNLIHCLYFSLSAFTTVGFGDVSARGWLPRLVVSVELCMSSLLHVLVFGKGLDLIVSRRQALNRPVTDNTFDVGKRE
jgi:hypothetical protein